MFVYWTEKNFVYICSEILAVRWIKPNNISLCLFIVDKVLRSSLHESELSYNPDQTHSVSVVTTGDWSVFVYMNPDWVTTYWYLRNIKHFPCWYTVISTRVEIGKTRNCVETRRPQGGVFSHNFEFFQFSRVLI